MGTRTIPFDDDTYRTAEDAADAAGLSLAAWVARAIRRAARWEDGVRAMAQAEAEPR